MSTITSSVTPGAESGGEKTHEQFLTRFPPKAQRILYAVGHMAAGFCTLQTVVINAGIEALDEAEAGDLGPSRTVGIMETAARGITLITSMIDEPLPLEWEVLRWVRRFLGAGGVGIAGGTTLNTWDGKTTPLARKAQTVVDVVLTVISVAPLTESIWELAETSASPEKSMCVLDETANCCEATMAWVHLCVMGDKEGVSKTAAAVAEAILIGAAGGMQIAQASVAINQLRTGTT